MLEMLARAVRHERETEAIGMDRRNTVTLFAYDVTVYIESSRELTEELIQTTSANLQDIK